MDIDVLAENHAVGKSSARRKRVRAMNEDKLNMEVRKFLKVVGVTSQREIEKAVRSAALAGKLTPGKSLKAKMHLRIAEIGLSHEIDGDIAVE
ncbi:MAG: DUF6494 family protein [Stellaceae bacterium]